MEPHSFAFSPPHNDNNPHPADAKPSPRILGGMGRMGAGWHGFVHLRPRFSSGAAGVVASIGNFSHQCEYRILRRRSVRSVFGWLGDGSAVGAGRRPVWARSHLDAHHYLLFAFHLVERLRHEYLDP